MGIDKIEEEDGESGTTTGIAEAASDGGWCSESDGSQPVSFEKCVFSETFGSEDSLANNVEGVTVTVIVSFDACAGVTAEEADDDDDDDGRGGLVVWMIRTDE